MQNPDNRVLMQQRWYKVYLVLSVIGFLLGLLMIVLGDLRVVRSDNILQWMWLDAIAAVCYLSAGSIAFYKRNYRLLVIILLPATFFVLALITITH